MQELLEYGFDPQLISRKKKSIKRSLLGHENFIAKRIAILGGSTTSEIKDTLELFLLKEGIKPDFYEGEYNLYFEELVFDNPALKEFNPDLIYIHTTSKNIEIAGEQSQSISQINDLVESEYKRYEKIWAAARQNYSCDIIQNNFELPQYRNLGNFDSAVATSMTKVTLELNRKFSEYCLANNFFHISDIHYLSARLGLDKWYDNSLWLSYKYALSFDAIPYLAQNVASIVKAIFGLSKKCIVLDLDNTLWGGVIGDDGLGGIQLGQETPVGEAHWAFQKYIKGLKDRGIILAVCSKNNEDIAKEAFSHPDSILKLSDFSSFKANWEPKSKNIQEIVSEINIGLNQIIFVDDNPVEREIVSSQLPQATVPNIGKDPSMYIEIVDKSLYFETTSLNADDLKRNEYYAQNSERKVAEAKFETYGDFLNNLNMKAEIENFKPVYLDRITQLTNKTNQFNLTTKRYSFSEIEGVSKDKANFISLYGRLEDKFGDNGLVSIVLSSIDTDQLNIDLWLMSCRVLKRDFEFAMFDALVEQALGKGIKTIHGTYLKTAKNSMVSDFYKELGFQCLIEEEDKSTWILDVDKSYTVKNRYIEVNNGQS